MDASNLHAFKYRTEDVLHQITVKSVKEARLNQLKQEIMNNDRLQSHFEDNPRELALLQDRALKPAIAKPHLTAVPKYLLPPGAMPEPTTEGVSERSKPISERRMNKRDRFRLKAQRKRNDPLKLNRGAVKAFTKTRKSRRK
jgi:ATP-dependent RNA helicase DDX56/DBP9